MIVTQFCNLRHLASASGILFLLVSCGSPSTQESDSQLSSSCSNPARAICEAEAQDLRSWDAENSSFAERNQAYIRKKQECARIKCDLF